MLKYRIEKGSYKEIKSVREFFLKENNFQIRYHCCHERNWSDTYIYKIDGNIIGYASIKGKEKLEQRDTIFEFYILPDYRNHISIFIDDLIKIAKPIYIESQTNEKLLTNLLYQKTKSIISDVILFEDDKATNLFVEGANFRKRKQNENVFGLSESDIGTYVIEKSNRVIATGDFLLHYNHPFADLFMEVEESYRRQGYGQYILQEIKKECYANGRVPAARCNKNNIASKKTLLKAGFKISGYMIIGEIIYSL